MACCGGKTIGNRTFHTNYREKPITVKFYARHDEPDVQLTESIKRYGGEVERRMTSDLHTTCNAPITENQVYGWLEKKGFKYPNDEPNLFRRPRVRDREIAILSLIYRAKN